MTITVASLTLRITNGRKKTEVKVAALIRKEVAAIAIIVIRSAISMIRAIFNRGITVVDIIRNGTIVTKRAVET